VLRKLNIYERLNKIIPKIEDETFIKGRGLGNEISFYVFDYDPKDELIVRDHIEYIKKYFSRPTSERKIIEFDLYKMMLDIANEKGILDKIFDLEQKKGKEFLYNAMTNFAQPSIFLDKIKTEVEGYNVVFLTGIGKVYPFVRSHTILNNLQEVLDKIPVILFYPGKYTGQSLELFGKFKDENYYRAFQLVDEKGDINEA
jgi:Domain of unknown function (DUF1788)